ncbi:hypothetical protein QBC38DRAFT_520144 [Podospora fimiseda]|uniref:Rhodanese domain-containing protein n=1 Tax=Podospora fimiseda TaxID=252190 RepID=A0AAN6YMY0_9PEZI|nr:hypothetical protein QBC38DRAFT_520144 [Podospora fimiseda]
MMFSNLPPWHPSDHPAPRAKAKEITRENVLEHLNSTHAWNSHYYINGDFVIVDLRPAEKIFQRGRIDLSEVVPASPRLYDSMPQFYAWLKGRGFKTVIFYTGSSGLKAKIVAGWLADIIIEDNNTVMESCVMIGGIHGWVAAGGKYMDWMIEFDERFWEKQPEPEPEPEPEAKEDGGRGKRKCQCICM